ncbi:hypothetical protein ABPG74_017612 [Tetrahymena malaccensis]
MGFTSLDLFSSQFSFNIKGQKMGNRTTTGSIFSIIIIAITFLYCIYVVKQYANNEIEPTYRSQMEINNSTQSLDIISNTFAYKMSFMDVEDDESTDQYTSIQVRAIYENYTLSYPLPVIAEQCRDPNLKYYQCLSQVQFRIGNDESVNQQLYQDIHNPDYNFRLTSLIITVKSCQSFKKNSTDCATQDEIDQMITQGSLNLKLPVYQFNIQTKKMELSYQSQTFYTSSDQQKKSNINLQNQRTSVKDGLFIQSEQRFSSPTNYNIDNQSVNRQNLLQNNKNAPYCYITLSVDQKIQQISIQYPTIPQILAQINGVFSLLMLIGIILRYISFKSLDRGLFMVAFKNIYQESYLQMLKNNKISNPIEEGIFKINKKFIEDQNRSKIQVDCSNQTPIQISHDNKQKTNIFQNSYKIIERQKSFVDQEDSQEIHSEATKNQNIYKNQFTQNQNRSFGPKLIQSSKDNKPNQNQKNSQNQISCDKIEIFLEEIKNDLNTTNEKINLSNQLQAVFQDQFQGINNDSIKMHQKDNQSVLNTQMFSNQIKRTQSEINNKQKIRKNLVDSGNFQFIQNQKQTNKIQNNKNPLKQDQQAKELQKIIFASKIYKQNDYLMSKGFSSKEKTQIQEQVDKDLDIFQLYKDLLFFKKAIMILFTPDQLATINLIGCSTNLLQLRDEIKNSSIQEGQFVFRLQVNYKILYFQKDLKQYGSHFEQSFAILQSEDLGSKRGKGTITGSLTSIAIFVTIFSYFIYIIQQYTNNQIEPTYRSQILLNNSTEQLEFITSPVAFKIQSRGYRDYNYLKSQAIATALFQNGTKTHSIRIISQQCEDPNLKGYDCLYQPFFNSFDNDEIYEKGIQEVQNKDYNYKLTMLIINVGTCFPEFQSDCNQQDELDDIMNRGVISIKLPVSQFDIQQKKLEWSYETFTFYTSSNLVNQPTINQQNQFVFVKDGMFIQSQNIYQSPVNYRVDNSNINRTYLVENQKYAPYFNLEIQLEQKFQQIHIQYPSLPSILAQVNSVFNLLMLLGVIMRYISFKSINQYFFMIALQNMFQEKYLQLLKHNKINSHLPQNKLKFIKTSSFIQNQNKQQEQKDNKQSLFQENYFENNQNDNFQKKQILKNSNAQEESLEINLENNENQSIYQNQFKEKLNGVSGPKLVQNYKINNKNDNQDLAKIQVQNQETKNDLDIFMISFQDIKIDENQCITKGKKKIQKQDSIYSTNQIQRISSDSIKILLHDIQPTENINQQQKQKNNYSPQQASKSQIRQVTNTLIQTQSTNLRSTLNKKQEKIIQKPSQKNCCPKQQNQVKMLQRILFGFQGTQRGKGTIIGSLTSITIFVFIFYYAVYIFEQYSRNQIEPTYRSQSLINNTTQSIDITSNIFAYDIGFKDQIVVDEQNYIQNSVLALFQNGTKTYSFQISQKQCQDPQLDTYKCLDQIQFNSNEILKQEIYNSDYNYKLISISLIIGSCIDFKQNEDNCSSQEEAEELMNSGVVLLKLPVSNYNTQTKQMEQSYQTINFFTSSDQVKQPIIRLQNQKILVKDGIFFQSEQIYQSTINYNIDTQSVNSVSKSNQNKSNNHNAQQEKPKEQNLFEQADCQSINLENLENQKIYKNQFAESQNGVFGPKIVKDQKEVSQNEKPVFRSQNIINNQTESVDIFSNPIGFLVAIKDQDLLKQEVQYTSVEIIALFKNATSNQYFKITTNKCQDPNYFWYSCLDKIIFEDYLKSSQEVEQMIYDQKNNYKLNTITITVRGCDHSTQTNCASQQEIESAMNRGYILLKLPIQQYNISQKKMELQYEKFTFLTSSDKVIGPTIKIQNQLTKVQDGIIIQSEQIYSSPISYSADNQSLVEQKCPKNYKCQVIQSEKTPNDQGESQDINLENNENQSVYQNLFIERQDGVIGPKIMKEVKENAQQIEVLLNKSKIQAQETKNEHDTFMISFQDIKTDENQCITKAHFQNPPSIFSQKQMQTVSNQFMKIQLQETQLTNNYSQPKKEIKKILHKQKSPQTQTQNIFNQSSCSPFTQNSKELNKIQDSLQNKEENFKKLQKIIFTFKEIKYLYLVF